VIKRFGAHNLPVILALSGRRASDGQRRFSGGAALPALYHYDAVVAELVPKNGNYSLPCFKGGNNGL
jgi:hypothetical protein